MKTTATIEMKDNHLSLSGEFNFETIVALWKQSLPLLKQHSQLTIDLSQVTSSNSAGLALLIEWMKYGKRENKTMTFIHVPAQLQSIAKVAGIDVMLSHL